MSNASYFSLPEPLSRMSDARVGGLVGLLVGDALGVPYEFASPEIIPKMALIDMRPPITFVRAHHGVPAGTWSDDGSQALCLLASLTEIGSLDLNDFAHKLVDWLTKGYMAVDQRVFDIGNQTANALSAIQSGTSPEESGPARAESNGNGSLMRALPIALWASVNGHSDERVVDDAHRQSLPTHGHPRSQVCCALYCLWARRELDRVPHPFEDAVAVLRSFYRGSVYEDELEEFIVPDLPPMERGTGYVVDSLQSARLCLEQPTFESIVKKAVSLGNDTDTTAAIAGGIAGIRYGLSGIPTRWLKALRGKGIVAPWLRHLLET